MPTYNYRCGVCNHAYSETRSVEDPQFFTKCHACGDDYWLDDEPAQ